MSNETGLGALAQEIRSAIAHIDVADTRTDRRFDQLEASVNDLYRKTQRPGWSTADDDDTSLARKSAIEMCHTRRNLVTPKLDAGVADDYTPSSSEIDDALLARKAFRSLLRHGEARLDHLEKKSLTAFSFGSNGYLLAPEMSNRVLSCLVSPTDVTGMVDHVAISSGSVRFFIDNARMAAGAWACQSDCFSNNPHADLSEGLGTLELKAEELRFVTCATSDLLQDANFNVENWLFAKVSEGFRITLNEAILLGDGIGKPLGLLNPNAGVQVCETAPTTPSGEIRWQDLVALKFEVPQIWWPGSAYFLNQHTAGMLMTMSGSDGRPLLTALPGDLPSFQIAGSPVIINSHLPNVAPGTTPILFGNIKKAYTMVDRRATTVQVDPYTVGFCTLFKFSCRVGGSTTCPNAMRLLRVR